MYVDRMTEAERYYSAVSRDVDSSELNIDKISSDVLGGVKEVERDERYINAQVFIFEYGSKELILYLENSDASHTFVDTIKPSERKEYETTILYRALRKFLDNVASKQQKDINYKLLTESKQVVSWANSTGNDIFHWKKIDIIPQEEYLDLHIFETTIEQNNN